MAASASSSEGEEESRRALLQAAAAEQTHKAAVEETHAWPQGTDSLPQLAGLGLLLLLAEPLQLSSLMTPPEGRAAAMEVVFSCAHAMMQLGDSAGGAGVLASAFGKATFPYN